MLPPYGVRDGSAGPIPRHSGPSKSTVANVGPAEEWHDQRVKRAPPMSGVNRNDVRVLESSERPAFSPEAGRQLDGDEAIGQVHLFGQVDAAERPATEFLRQPEPKHGFAGFWQRSRVRPPSECRRKSPKDGNPGPRPLNSHFDCRLIRRRVSIPARRCRFGDRPEWRSVGFRAGPIGNVDLVSLPIIVASRLLSGDDALAIVLEGDGRAHDGTESSG